MFGFVYTKVPPTQYLIVHKNGRVVREGAGVSVFHYAPLSTVSLVPVGSVDAPFSFEETTADFQSVTLTGQLTYRVADPRRTASLLDFSVGPTGRYLSDDPVKLGDRVVNQAQVIASAIVHRTGLRGLLGQQLAIAEEVLNGLKANPTLAMLGVEVLGASVLAIKPAPETAKALEADAREQFLRQADEAVYARRNAAVEQERRIRETELNTELVVEEKQRQIKAKQMEGQIAVEQQRAELISTQTENDRKAADARAYALEASLRPLRETDWRVLLAASAGQIDPRTGVALAVRELAENANKIGELNISPELLTSLIKSKG